LRACWCKTETAAQRPPIFRSFQEENGGRDRD
jgi:hypothetical protein